MKKTWQVGGNGRLLNLSIFLMNSSFFETCHKSCHRQVLIPDDGELEDSSRRWQGRAVLLAWPNLEGLQLEVREESQHTHQAQQTGGPFGSNLNKWTSDDQLLSNDAYISG